MLGCSDENSVAEECAGLGGGLDSGALVLTTIRY